MSQISYNGIGIPYLFTEQHQTTHVTDPSNTDVIYRRTTIRVRGVLHPGGYPHVEGERLAETAARITGLLTLPRRRLVYRIGDTDFIDSGRDGDDENGPWPDAGGFQIDPCPTEGSFVVHFGVSTCRRLCTGADSRGFLSLKWTDQETDDLRGNKTRRRSGLLIVSRQFTPNADSKRNLVIPLVPAGFRRESSDYTLSEDGLRLRFVFVDKQLHKGVPFPTVRVTGAMAETVPQKGGLRRGELTVRLEGRPGTNARDLLNHAVRIGMSRVYASNPARDENKPQGRILIGGGVRESLNDDETAVELQLVWTIKPATSRITGRQANEIGFGAFNGMFPAAPGSEGVTTGGSFGGGVINNVPFPSGGSIDSRTQEGRPQAGLPVLAPWLGLDFPGATLAAGVPSTTRGTGLAAAVRPLAEFLHDPCGSIGESELRAGFGSQWVGTAPGGATVTVRPGNPQPDDDEGVPADPLPGTWDEWRMSYLFKTQTGYINIPSTARGEPEERVRIGNPRKRLFVKWELMRTGGVPPLPDNAVPVPGGYTGDGSSDSNWTLEVYARNYENIDVAGDGVSFVYQAAGEAELQALDASKAAEGYPCPPWLVPNKRPAAAAIARAGGIPTGQGGFSDLVGQPPVNP